MFSNGYTEDWKTRRGWMMAYSTNILRVFSIRIG